MLDLKVLAIRQHFAEWIGSKLISYETAELLLSDGTWSPWPDLPIRLFADSDRVIAISWSRFDDLWIANDSSLPFSIEGSTIRWVRNSIDAVNACVGGTIHSVSLGRGQLSIEDREIEIWTRLLIKVGDRWLEIFNALDENGYKVHTAIPTGDFRACI